MLPCKTVAASQALPLSFATCAFESTSTSGGKRPSKKQHGGHHLGCATLADPDPTQEAAEGDEHTPQGLILDFKHEFKDLQERLDMLSLQMSSCLDCVGAIFKVSQDWEHHMSLLSDARALPREQQLPRARPQQRQETNASAASLASEGEESDIMSHKDSRGSRSATSRWRQAKGPPPLPSCSELGVEGQNDGTVPSPSLTFGAITSNKFGMTKCGTKQLGVFDAVEALQLARTRRPIVATVWSFLEDPDSSAPARSFSFLWPLFIVVSVLTALCESLRDVEVSLPDGFFTALGVFNGFAEGLFLVEAATRFAVYPSTRLFFVTISCIIDMLASATLFPRLASQFTVPEEGSGSVWDVWRYVLLCFVPTCRLLKLLRTFRYSKLVVVLMESVGEALKFLLYVMVVILVVFSCIFFILEPRSNIPSLPMSIWYSVLTMTTVGFMEPQSPTGHLASSSLMILSVLYMSMPLGVLGSAFTQIWVDRERILLIAAFRSRLDQYGYQARDIKTLFHYYDRSGDGELSVAEFRLMISDMKVGLSEESILHLYDGIDRDGGGSIDAKEFVKALYPESFHIIFQLNKKKVRRSRSGPREKKGEQSSTLEESSGA